MCPLIITSMLVAINKVELESASSDCKTVHYFPCLGFSAVALDFEVAARILRTSISESVSIS